ncbi:TonB-dependent receptor [Alicycliphilus sp. B1]|nr:TonB-dependent receptor [Alicycliphilus sp. B1]
MSRTPTRCWASSSNGGAAPGPPYLLADNVTDRRYASSYAIRNQATAAQPGYLPGLGRNVAAGVTYKF